MKKTGRKRYYKVGEQVTIRKTKEVGEVIHLDVRPKERIYKAVVEIARQLDEHTLHITNQVFDLWEIDKLPEGENKTANIDNYIGLDRAFAQVREFQVAFNHPVADKPTQMPIERAMSRYTWMLEELDEFLEALTLVDQADALVDLIYLAEGTLVELGVLPQRLFDIVHEANMSKLFPDGKPRYKEDNKVMKPEGWQAPEPKLQAEIERQISLSSK